MQNKRWILPEGIDEVLPHQAPRVELVRRQLLDMYQSWGYELIIPPFVEYLDSLLVGTGSELDLQTFKLTDQMTGRMMGVRADITPQAARIDAHQLRREEPTRLCYLATVLRTRPSGFSGSRSPLQIGAELFGHSGIESDVEILQLMIQTLRCAGVENVSLDLGHVGIYRGLAQQAGLDQEQESALFNALQRKALPEIQQLVEGFGLDDDLSSMLCFLAELNGEDCLVQAEKVLANASADVRSALDHIAQVAELARRLMPDVSVHFDLAELRGYHYKTGIVFAAFVPGQGDEIARGGRYDGIGEVFGRARPAVGFSADLNTLLNLAAEEDILTENKRVFVPWSDKIELQAKVTELRKQGAIVIYGLPGQSGGAKEMQCTWTLMAAQDGQWVLTEAL